MKVTHDRSGKRVYDFTDGLKEAKERVETVPDDIGNRADLINESRIKREPTQAEKMVDAAMALELNEQMPERELNIAKICIEQGVKSIMLICATLKGQIDEATARMHRNGGEDDTAPGWWKRVNGASRAKSWQRNQLQTKMAEVNRLIRLQRKINNDRERKDRNERFIQLVRQHISNETFLMIWQKVNEEFESR